MCGINGIFYYDQPVAKAAVERMNDQLSHRGPDDHGIYEAPHIVLGHRRLSIIDLSRAGQQPMSTADGRYTLVFNGELYNYKEVRSQLRGVDFKTETDTEVVLQAFAAWGKNCLRAFNGMFAFAVWDKAEKSLFIARDRMGIKPLYFYRDDQHVIFSSEVRALLASDLVPRKLNHDSVVDYLRFQTVHAPYTIVDRVYMLQPGHYLQINEEQTKMESWWNMTDLVDRTSLHSSYKEVCGNIRDRLYTAVERRLVADVPFGAFLSGGIDSSAIVGIMSEVGQQQVKTFSVSFNEEAFSEAKYARIIANKFKTDHREIVLKPEDFLQTIPEALSAMDHPSGDGPNTYVVSKATKEAGVTMALSGLGGDELFAGYDIFKRALELEGKKWLLSFPVGFRRMGGSMLKAFKPGAASDKIYETLKLARYDISYTYPISRRVLMDEVIEKLVTLHDLPEDRVAEIALETTGYESRGFQFPGLSQVSFNEISTYMQNVLLRDTDQMSMASALEVRVPFLDHELAEYVFNVSDRYKYPHSPKKLLIDSLHGLLPSEVVDRPKMGFVLPWENWLKQDLKSFSEDRLKALGERGLFHSQAIQKLWAEFQKGNPRFTWARVWPMVVLEDWMQKNNVEV